MAELLEEYGLVAAPEQIKQIGSTRHMPDVLVQYRGLRLAIESEFDSSQAESKAITSVLKRIEHGIARFGVAVIYPSSLRKVTPNEIKQVLGDGQVRFAVITENDFPEMDPGEVEFSSIDFIEGQISSLVESLQRSYNRLVEEEAVVRAVEKIQGGIESFASAIHSQQASIERFGDVLGVKESDMDDEERDSVVRISALIIINALIFQEILSQTNSKVTPLESIIREENVKNVLADHWKMILDDINYHPIFHAAYELLTRISSDRAVDDALHKLFNIADQIVQWRAPLRHDLAGRIFHQILVNAKYLGAMYTSVPAATILLKLALNPSKMKKNWANLEEIKRLQIGDMACGTGTLLMACADAIADNYLTSCAEENKEPDLDSLHESLVENSLYGYDVQPSAIQLTASTLALRVPDMPINTPNLYTLELGGVGENLGSLDFLESGTIQANLFTEQMQVTGSDSEARSSVSAPNMDLCVMNPPFTSSRKANLLFGTLPNKERKSMQNRLKKIVKKKDVPANIVGGLSPVFVALAHKYLKDNGRLALVLPRSVLSGVSWSTTRELIADNYQLEFIIVSHEPNNWNFSENTSLSETLLIAEKSSDTYSGEVTCVNLWHNPLNVVEALSSAHSLMGEEVPNIYRSQGEFDIRTDGKKFGEAINIDWEELQQGTWTAPCAFAQTDLIRTFYHFQEGKMYVPTKGIVGDLPLCRLENLGELGYDPRDLYDAFEVSDSKTAYPSLWGHDSKKIQTMLQPPNEHLTPLSKARDGRSLRDAPHLWEKAGNVQLVQRYRTNTKRLTAAYMDKKALGYAWWSFSFKSENFNITLGSTDREKLGKTLTLWMNSTISIVNLLGCREETEGAWVQFKKPTLGEMLVLDLTVLGRQKINRMAERFDDLSDSRLSRLSNADEDKVRKEIDKAVSDALNLPNLRPLRSLLSREPLICLDSTQLIDN